MRVDTAVGYLEETYKRTLNHLTEYLNDVHMETHSVRFPRIILGTWLYHHLHSLYDRFVHLDHALAKFLQLEIISLEPNLSILLLILPIL